MPSPRPACSRVPTSSATCCNSMPTSPATRSCNMRADIVVLPGDGIGPEVTQAAVDVLHAIGQRYRHDFIVRDRLIGGIAIDTTGTPLPDGTLAACREADAVLLGAVGGPKWSDPQAKVRPEQGLLARSEEHTSELQSLMRISYAVICL